MFRRQLLVQRLALYGLGKHGTCSRRSIVTLLTLKQEPAKRVYEDGSEEWLSSYLDKVRK
jgi:hypothetical protein